MKVFVLQHVHQVTSEQKDSKLIGIYSTHERARAAQSRIAKLAGFHSALNGFHIDEYELDSDHWTEGYVAFVGYVGPQEIHDATILGLERKGDCARVYLKSCEGRLFTLEFVGVKDVHAVHPEGMILYALSEAKAKPPWRCFVFANWDEESDAALEIVAQDFSLQTTDV